MLCLPILFYLTPSCSYTYHVSECIQLLQMHQVIGLVENKNGLSRNHLVHISVFKAKLAIQLQIFWLCQPHCRELNTKVSQCKSLELYGKVSSVSNSVLHCLWW